MYKDETVIPLSPDIETGRLNQCIVLMPAIHLNTYMALLSFLLGWFPSCKLKSSGGNSLNSM
jgi:hypothetical protein